MKRLIKINGIHCLECKMKVEDQLNALVGVAADVDLETGIAAVTHNKTVSEKQILDAIKLAGYDGIVL